MRCLLCGHSLTYLRPQEERIKLSGERERAKLIKRDQQERKQLEKAARDVRVRKQQMEEAETKRC